MGLIRAVELSRWVNLPGNKKLNCFKADGSWELGATHASKRVFSHAKNKGLTRLKFVYPVV